MKDTEILPFCHKSGIKLPPSWRHSLQAIRYHNKNETRRHFKYKSAIGFELMRQGQTIFTELNFILTSGSVRRMRYPCADLFWLDEKIIVEFESNLTPEIKALKEQQFKRFNTFVFDIRKNSIEDILERIGALDI